MDSTSGHQRRPDDKGEWSQQDLGTAYRYRFGDAEFDESRLELTVAGRKAELEPRPTQVLCELLRRVDEVVTRDELLEAVWEGRPTVDNVVANAISKLRKALGPDAGARLVNLPRTGYRFRGPVERSVVGSFTHANRLEFAAHQPVPHRPHYTLLEPLGPSVKSNVWLARHAKLPGQQRVFKFAFDGSALRGLKREFTIQRLLQTELGHGFPLVAILDHNFERTPFFIEYDYVGPDLLAWSLAPDGLALMPTEERMRIYRAFLSAVVAAHGAAVIHKDLKPANVLMAQVDGRWSPFIADFGNSQLLDPDRVRRLGLTLAGMTVDALSPEDGLAGTAMYLAPELLAGQAPNAQSDIYAAGVMLYQLMAGDLRRPLATGWERHIADEFIRADIAAATEGNPQQRLRSAAELLDRLQRLDDRRAAQRQKLLVEQRAAEAERRAARVRARRPWVIAAGVAMAVGLSVSLWTQHRLRAALSAADEQRARAAAIAEFLHRDVLQTPDYVFLSSARPLSLLQILRSASRAAESRFADDALTEAATRRRLADTFLRLASLIDARKELDRAQLLLEPRVPANHPDLMMVRYMRVRLHTWAGRFAEARELLAKTDATDPGRPAMAPDETAYYAARARFELLFAERNFQEALPLALELVSMADAIYAGTPHLRDEVRVRLAQTQFRIGQNDAAVTLLAQLQGGRYAADALMTEFKVNQLGVGWETAMQRSDSASALLLLRQARSMLVSQSRPNMFYLGFIDRNLSAALHAEGDLRGSETASRSSQQAFEQVLGEDHQYTRFAQLWMGFVLLDQGRTDEATRSFASFRTWVQEQRTQGWLPFINFGEACLFIRRGRGTEALPLLASIQPSDLRHLTLSPAWHQRLQAERGLALMLTGRSAEGRREVEAATAALRTLASSTWLADHYQDLMRANPTAATVSSR